MRTEALCACWHLGPGASPLVPALVAATEDEDRSIREDALWALARVDPQGDIAIPVLSRALSDPDSGVRLAAVSDLGHFVGRPDEVAVPLWAALEDEDSKVQTCALAGLANVATFLKGTSVSREDFAAKFREEAAGENPARRRAALMGLGNLECSGEE